MVVISLGGSIVAPDGPDVSYLAGFRELIGRHLTTDRTARFVLVVGGGAPARSYQRAYRELAASRDLDSDSLDWIGIMATRLNAELVRHTLSSWCTDDVVTDPSSEFAFEGRVLVAAGWKPGFSTDFDAVFLADRFGAKTVINLSNIERVYSADPKIDPNAIPLDKVSWADFVTIVGTGWNPGSNLPFDPVASEMAANLHLGIIAADGRNLSNLAAILSGGEFVGTQIGPE